MHQTDTIHIYGLRLECRIGVSPQERRRRQIITADIALKCDLKKAGQSDCLEDTIDYSVIAKKISSLAAKEKFCLLESLAKRIAEICLADSKVKAVTVKVAKKGILSNVSSVETEISRSQDFTICHSRLATPKAWLDRESRNSEKTRFPLARE